MSSSGANSGGIDLNDGLCVAGALSGCTSSHGLVANHVMANRVTVPKTGTLHDLSLFVVNASGNVIVAVYDTGDAVAGSRTKLWDSGSVAVAGANVWQIIGDPALAVVGGRQLDLAVIADNAVAQFLTWPNLGNVNGANRLPAGFLPSAGGALGKMSWEFAAGGFAAPAAVTEAQAAAIGVSFAIPVIARVA